MMTFNVTPQEFDAILAGLRLLAQRVRSGELHPDDAILGILTNGDGHDGLAPAAIDELAQRLNCGD